MNWSHSYQNQGFPSSSTPAATQTQLSTSVDIQQLQQTASASFTEGVHDDVRSVFNENAKWQVQRQDGPATDSTSDVVVGEDLSYYHFFVFIEVRPH